MQRPFVGLSRLAGYGTILLADFESVAKLLKSVVLCRSIVLLHDNGGGAPYSQTLHNKSSRNFRKNKESIVPNHLC
jgi:hypothetical protein